MPHAKTNGHDWAHLSIPPFMYLYEASTVVNMKQASDTKVMCKDHNKASQCYSHCTLRYIVTDGKSISCGGRAWRRICYMPKDMTVAINSLYIKVTVNASTF